MSVSTNEVLKCLRDEIQSNKLMEASGYRLGMIDAYEHAIALIEECDSRHSGGDDTRRWQLLCENASIRFGAEYEWDSASSVDIYVSDCKGWVRFTTSPPGNRKTYYVPVSSDVVIECREDRNAA